MAQRRDRDYSAGAAISNLLKVSHSEMRRKQAVFILLLCSTIATAARAADTPYLYKVSLVQAAPGKLLDLIDLYKARALELKQAGDEAPLWMRHSQGDHWDLMVLFPVGSYSEYYQHERITKRL